MSIPSENNLEWISIEVIDVYVALADEVPALLFCLFHSHTGIGTSRC